MGNDTCVENDRIPPVELRCRSTFKEILTVKYGIKKLEFHCDREHFFIELDMSSFSSNNGPQIHQWKILTK